MRQPDGTPLTASNYPDYLKSELIRAAQIAKNAGADLPDTIGLTCSHTGSEHLAPPLNGGVRPPMNVPMRRGRGGRSAGEYVTGIDLPKYLNYVVSTQPLKGVSAFDSQIEGINRPSGENEEFGDDRGSSVNFTEYTAQKNGTILDTETAHRMRLMNPMRFIGDT